MPEPQARLRKQCGTFCCVLAVIWSGGCREAGETSRRSPVDGKSPPAAAPLSPADAAWAAGEEDRLVALELLSAAEAGQVDPAGLVRAAQTTWSFPAGEWTFPATIEWIHPAPEVQVWWLALAEPANTLIRFHAGTGSVEAVLFPLPGEASWRGASASPCGKRLLIDRAGLLLLVDAHTLKPLADCGVLPEPFSHDAAIAWTPDGLLFAHPAGQNQKAGNHQEAVHWQVRDAATGEILRSHPIAAPAEDPVLAASLNRARLRLLHASGLLKDVPVSPVEPASERRMHAQADRILHAILLPGGRDALVRCKRQSFEPSEWGLLACDEPVGDEPEPDALAWLENLPWSRLPNSWHGLFDGREDAPLRVTGETLRLDGLPLFRMSGEIRAVARGPEGWLMIAAGSRLESHRIFPSVTAPLLPETIVEGEDAAHLSDWAAALTGWSRKPAVSGLQRLSPEERRRLVAKLPMDRLARLLPGWQASGALGAMAAAATRTIDPGGLAALNRRLAIARGDEPPPASAKELALALRGGDAVRLRELLATAANLPREIARLGLARVAWLEDRKADAFALWNDAPPDLAASRLREDWLGWEGVDFQAAVEIHSAALQEELDSYEIPVQADEAACRAVASRLFASGTRDVIGRERLAAASLRAALACATHTGLAETTLQLARQARALGAPSAPCLRAEAMALTAMGDHVHALPRWIELITEHPWEEQEPGDYAEAAYTAFENSDPRQAMEILDTGIRRFPQDAHFALRAGWVALLTGHPDEAHAYLLAGERVGFAAEKQENALLLLAISAAQTGHSHEARLRLDALTELDPAWETLEPLEQLPWPDEMKQALEDLFW